MNTKSTTNKTYTFAKIILVYLNLKLHFSIQYFNGTSVCMGLWIKLDRTLEETQLQAVPLPLHHLFMEGSEGPGTMSILNQCLYCILNPIRFKMESRFWIAIRNGMSFSTKRLLNKGRKAFCQLKPFK